MINADITLRVYLCLCSLVRHIHYQSTDLKAGEFAEQQTRINEDKFKKLVVTYKVRNLFIFSLLTMDSVAAKQIRDVFKCQKSHDYKN